MARKINFLDLVPRRAERFKFEIGEGGAVTIFVENRGIFNFVAQKLFGKPRVSRVSLDEIGSFVWLAIDGVRDVRAIADALRKRFGKRVEPLYERCATYVKTLENYGFVELIQI